MILRNNIPKNVSLGALSKAPGEDALMGEEMLPMGMVIVLWLWLVLGEHRRRKAKGNRPDFTLGCCNANGWV